MTIAEALKIAGMETADGEVLLAHLLKHDRSWVLAHQEGVLSEKQENEFRSFVNRRKKHEPISYITEKKEFFGREFFVHPSVLIPRPATELLVEHALKILDGGKVEKISVIDDGIVAWSELKAQEKPSLVIDVGTGSGCIAITLACERQDIAIIATDSSSEALEVAKKNAEAHGVQRRISFVHEAFSDFDEIDEPFLVVSNPPYIPTGTILMNDVRNYEPQEALFSGRDGTEVLKKIVCASRAHPKCIGFIVECKTDQANSF